MEILSCKNVAFKYNESTGYALSDCTFSVKKGEKVKVARVTSDNWYFALVGERYVAYMAAKYMKKG